jgi:site-specific DNA-methyltransferase (adenine-specific)
MLGDALSILESVPDETIDFCMTSPPYWNKRQYHNGGIGLEENYKDYITHLMRIFAQVKRVLKPSSQGTDLSRDKQASGTRSTKSLYELY